MVNLEKNCGSCSDKSLPNQLYNHVYYIQRRLASVMNVVVVAVVVAVVVVVGVTRVPVIVVVDVATHAAIVVVVEAVTTVAAVATLVVIYQIISINKFKIVCCLNIFLMACTEFNFLNFSEE